VIKIEGEKLLNYYRRHLGYLANNEEQGTEALLALIARSQIEDTWQSWTEEQRTLIHQADNMLIQKRKLIELVLPNAEGQDRRHWWWFLHEGPQVRPAQERETAG
jgi:hypothetical protein